MNNEHDSVTLSAEEFTNAFSFLQSAGMKLPHDYIPGSTPGGRIYITTKEEYDAEPYNPPSGFPDLEYDLEASQKPDWWAVVEASRTWKDWDLRNMLSRQLSQECRRRITKAFDASDVFDELFKRDVGETKPEQYEQRTALLYKYRDLKGQVTEMTLEQKEAFDPTDESHWT